MKAKTISISAKCSDLFHASVLDENGAELFSCDGYVPSSPVTALIGNHADGVNNHEKDLSNFCLHYNPGYFGRGTIYFRPGLR
jgi:hypothetical protein